MKMNPLGRTGIAISEICLGTMTWGEQNSEADGHAQMDHAVEQGINFFDTAEMYPTNPIRAETAGRTEEIIGSWLKARGRRDDIVIATKIVGKGNKTVRDGAPANALTIREAVENSLKRLGTDHIDLYQIHWPNRGSYHFRQNWAYAPWKQDKAQALADLEETVATADALVKEGKIRALGVSNDTVWGVAKMLEIAERSGGPRVASVQNEYNLMCRLFDTDWAELSHHEDVGLLTYSPLAAGILTGKYLDGAIPAGSRRSITSAYVLVEPSLRELGGFAGRRSWGESASLSGDRVRPCAPRHDPIGDNGSRERRRRGRSVSPEHSTERRKVRGWRR